MKAAIASIFLAVQLGFAQEYTTAGDLAAERLAKILSLGPGDFNALVLDSTFQIIGNKNKETGLNATGTGFIVAQTSDEKKSAKKRFVLLTAAHVLTACLKSGDYASIRFRYRGADPLTWSLEDHQVRIGEKGHPLWTQHPTADVAALEVEVPSGAIGTVLSVDFLADKDSIQKEMYFARGVYALGFPFGEVGAAGFPLLRPAEVTSRSVDGIEKFALSLQIYPGDSGGPVYIVERDNQTIHVLIVGLMVQALAVRAGQAQSGTNDILIFVGVGYVVPSTELREVLNALPRRNKKETD
jgi:hypothetical protein